MWPFPKAKWRYVMIALFLGLGASIALPPLTTATTQPTTSASATIQTDSVQVILSPGATDAMVAAIDSAQSTIDILMFEFSSTALKSALQRAEQRGVQVRIVLDPKVNQNFGTASFLENNSVEVKWSSKDYVYTHAKLAVIDQRRVLVGSINWSNNALKNNREAEVLIDNVQIAAQFQQAFDTDWSKATDYT
ncbi:MAG TPA: phospholipase D-like domain-containing protein [Candidatus Norongarragalinales archaeon]|jgi:phosphatidylserine/phosphatidylglycerophosphate/cardiolipin synthase-like enzyme|nr:phospholipase D-like domain-containing protein [Candidatus Norongarragalinales archaeon]